MAFFNILLWSRKHKWKKNKAVLRIPQGCRKQDTSQCGKKQFLRQELHCMHEQDSGGIQRKVQVDSRSHVSDGLSEWAQEGQGTF